MRRKNSLRKFRNNQARLEANKIHKTRITAVLLAILLAVCYFSPVSAQTEANVTIHFIDVGQGDSIFIDTANKDVLIDGGSASQSQAVLDYLDSLNITHIHLVIATHMHEDHIGGLVAVLNSALAIDEVLVNNQSSTSATYANFIALAQTHNLTVAQRGQTYILTETANLTVANPVQPLEFSDQNDNSIVTRLQAGNTSFLFTGDAEEPAEDSMLISSVVSLKCDVLKIGHHGSNTATSQTFLDIVDPQTAVICAGIDNKYGHPHNETIQKLLAKGVTIYGTYASGTIIATTDGTTITFPSNPEPIPETTSTLTLTTLATMTLLAIMVYRRKLHKTSESLGNQA
jgi:competence protein ComEC